MSALLDSMIRQFPHEGRVMWIGARPARREAVITLETTEIAANGLVADRRENPGKRAVSLIQWEHLPVIAGLTGRDTLDPALLRRNIAVSGINLVALRKAEFRIGTAVLRGTGLCAPCTRMEEALGPGGFNAVRGHGGITAEVVTPGTVGIGDGVAVIAVV